MYSIYCIDNASFGEPCKNGWTDRNAIWMQTCAGPTNHVLGKVHISASWRIRLNDPCAASMRTVNASNYFDRLFFFWFVEFVPSVLWRCWLGGRKGIRPVKTEWWVLAWLSVWSEVHTCTWPSWCHCHSLSLASAKSRLVLPFWYRLTRVIPEKGPLNMWWFVESNSDHHVISIIQMFGNNELWPITS